MEFDITVLVESFDDENLDARDFSGSRAELGDNAADITWSNAIETFTDFENDIDYGVIYDLVADNRGQLVDYFASTGGWTREELKIYEIYELGALFLQEVAFQYRQFIEGSDGYLYRGEDDYYIYLGV